MSVRGTITSRTTVSPNSNTRMEQLFVPNVLLLVFIRREGLEADLLLGGEGSLGERMAWKDHHDDIRDGYQQLAKWFQRGPDDQHRDGRQQGRSLASLHREGARHGFRNHEQSECQHTGGEHLHGSLPARRGPAHRKSGARHIGQQTNKQ